MEILLNSWRGTGNIFSIYKFNITGTMIYALYTGLLKYGQRDYMERCLDG